MSDPPHNLDYERTNKTPHGRASRFVASLCLLVLGVVASLYFVGSLRLAVVMGLAGLCLGLVLPQRELAKLFPESKQE